MPGYYIHFASCGGHSLKNRSFVLGVEAPDILKKHVKFCGGIEEAHAKYDSLRTSEMPEYCELQARILQKETANSNEGLHYGLSSQPDVKACWFGLSETQMANPFYRGYVWTASLSKTFNPVVTMNTYNVTTGFFNKAVYLPFLKFPQVFFFLLHLILVLNLC